MDRTRRDRPTNGTAESRRIDRRRLLSAIGTATAVAVAGCTGDGDDDVVDADENDPEDIVGHDHGDHGGHEHDHGGDEDLLADEDLAVVVPPSPDEFEQLRLVDYGTVAAGLETVGAVLADEPDLTDDDPGTAHDDLAAVLETVRNGFLAVEEPDDELADEEETAEPEVTLWSTLTATEEGWLRTDDRGLAEDAAVARLERARVGGTSRVEGDRREAIEAATVADAVGGCVLESYADAGEFHDGNGVVDAESTGVGLGMTLDWLARERHAEGATAVLESTDVVDLARETAAALDHYWVDEIGAYDFAYWQSPVGSDGASYTPGQLGAVVGGQLAVAAILDVSGATDAATTLLERAETTLETLLDGSVLEPAGLPAQLEFADDGVAADAETVDVADCWRCVDRLESGLAIADDLATDLDLAVVAGAVDDLATAALERGVLEGHHLDADGHVVAELEADGTPVDDRTTARALGWFLTGAGRALRRRDLGADTGAVVDAYLENYEYLRASFLLESTPEA